MNYKQLGKLFCTVSLLSASTFSYAAIKSPFSYNGSVDFFTDNNVNKANRDVDTRADTGAIFTGSVNYARGINRLSAFLASSSLSFEEYSEFEGLSNTKFSVSASYIFQNRISFAAPSYRIFLELNTLDSETDIRDRTGLILGAELKKRLTDKLRLNLGLTYSSEEADGEVFDLDKTRLFANFDLQVNKRVAAYTTLNYINGGIVSTARANAAWALPLINNAEAIEFDNAFGGERTGQAAYRLDDTTTTLLTFGANIGIDNKSSVDISADIINSSADDNIEYDRQILRSVYLRRF